MAVSGSRVVSREGLHDREKGIGNLCKDGCRCVNSLVWWIPPELGQFTNLTWLNLESNSLSGPLPDELGNLENLRHLLLSYNQLSGHIPSELGRLAKLVKLDLGHMS